MAKKPQGPYGRLELKSKYHKFLFMGLMVAAAFHFLGIGSYFLALKLQETDEENIPVVRMLKYSEMGPPPSIQNTDVAPAVAVAAAAARPTVGIPVPVPDAEVAPEATIASQTELSQQVSNIPEVSGEGTKVEIQQDIKVDVSQEDEPDQNAFIPVEKQPQPIKQPQPRYPELAQRAGIEGTVWVKILVDKEGKPKKCVIVKSDAEVFDESAKEAAMNSLFTPAVMNNGPVACWVVIPYKFKLK
ncbi:MAG TPA: TonB family protein [Bacteroidota bacterium]|jgi:protein TonB|nr:TonB family protein [Bacteroidota bacterium]